MSGGIEIQLFGDFAVKQDGQLVSGLDSPRMQALLAYLLLHREAPQPRQHLAFLFWLDSGEAQARTNLRNLLHRLRQAWPESRRYLAIEARSIGWRPQVHFTLDVADFEAHLQRASATGDADRQLQHLQQAIALYRNDLLPSCYDDWIQPQRARLHQAFLHALEQAADLWAEQGNDRAAIQALQRLIQTDPLQEAAYRRLMDLYARHEDRAAALRVYYRCVAVLGRELGVGPDAATQAAYQRLLSFGPSASLLIPTAPVRTSLTGRDLEWEQLTLAWHQVTAGKRMPLLALIHGEAGIGKTRLATELADWVQRQGGTVAASACYALEAGLSLTPVAGWLRALPLDGLAPVWRAELARLLPELSDRAPSPSPEAFCVGAPAEPWQKRCFYEALVMAILAQRQPILLRLEDGQWSDAETLAWLHYLLRPQADARLMVVITARMEEVGPEHPLLLLLATLRRQGRLLEIDLPPLDAAGTAALAAMLLGEALPPDAAAALYRHSEGNPLFIVEAICSDLECGGSASTLQVLLDAAESPHWGEPAPLSPRVQAVLRGRLAQLSPGARALLEGASVIGRSFTSDILVRSMDIDEGEMVAALDELWRRHIVRDWEGGAYDFSHDQLRQTAYYALSPARRRWLHGRVAQALETMESGRLEELAAQLAFHYEEAGQAQKALEYHRQAAARAERLYAFQAAAVHLQRAVALLDRVAPEDGPL